MNTSTVTKPNWQDALLCLMLVVIAVAYLGSFRSSDLAGVDGAARCFAVMDGQQPGIHGNNHMLYEYNLAWFHRLADSLAGQPDGPMEYFRRSSWLNILCAGAALVVVYLLGRGLGMARWLALSACGLLLFSKPVMLCSLHPNEPLPGFLFALAGFALCLLARGNMRWPAAVVAGLLFAYGMASYQSMAALGPAAALALLWPATTGERWLPGIWRAAALGLSFAGGVVLIYGWAYAQGYGVKDVAGFIERFTALDGQGDKKVWGSFAPGHFVGFTLAWPHQFFNMPTGGIRQTYLSFPGSIWNLLGLFASSLLACGLSFFAAWQSWLNRSTLNKRVLAVLLTGLLCAALPLIYWSGTYAKLWLQTFLMLCLLTAFLLASAGASSAWPARLARPWLGILCVAMFAWNTTQLAMPLARGKPDVMQQVVRWDAAIPDNAIVLTEWNDTSTYFIKLYPRERRLFSFASMGVDLPVEQMQAQLLVMAKDAAKLEQPIYVAGILHQTPEIWSNFYGAKMHLPYRMLDAWRSSAETLDNPGLPDTVPLYAVPATAILRKE